MNDKNVINTISAIYFTIVSFLSFIFLLLVTIFIILQNGLYIDNISITNVNVKQLYIKWNEKVDISIKEISIDNKQSNIQTKINYKDVDRYLKSLSLASNWFKSIVINKIKFNDATASFKYKDGQRGFIVASSPDFHINSSLYFESGFLNMHIIELKDFKREINLNGSIFFNPKDIELSALINININNDLDAKIFFDTNEKRAEYKLIANKELKDITHLINIANLPKEVRYWALDAIEMSHATIDSASGFIEFDKLDEAYKNIHIKATANKMNYAYDKQLDSIHTQKTLLEFKDGILYIYPKEAYSYGMYLDKSWLKIDFTTKEEILTLHLLFDGKINKSMLKILNRYKIKLPFLQKKGTVATNLTLAVNLITIDIDAKGDFFIKKANVDYIGLNIDIFDAYIKLDNHDVQIKDMKAHYKDIAKATVDVKYDAKTSKGIVSFRTEYIGLDKGALVLDKNPINVTYNISPKGDTINVDKSKWKYNDYILNINKVTLPFDLDTLLVKLPVTYFEAQGIGSGFIGGNINIKSMKINLRTDILKFKHFGIEFSKSNTPVNISYDEKLIISPVSNVLFHINDSEFDLNNAVVEIGAQNINVHHANLLSTDGLLSTEVNAFYDMNNHSGIFDLKNLNIEDKANKNLYYFKDSTVLSFSGLKENVNIFCEELNSKLTINDLGWSAEIDSLAKLSDNSDFLKDVNLTKGKVNLSKSNNEKSIRFTADIVYPYKLLVKNNKPIHDYKIKGKISSKKSVLNINESIDVKIDDSIAVNIKNSGINIPELLNLLADMNTSSSENSVKSLTVDALNSHLYIGHDRRVISDEIHLQYAQKILTAQLKHKNGYAGFKLDNKKIHLYGENFNNKFMENLFSLSKFKGGKLNFSMNGTISNYDGLFYIVDTTIVDYKMINNILAFVNTVPSLATFSLPGYSKSGLKVKSAYMNFNAKNSVFHISDFFLDSKEIDILGGGVADLNKDKIDVTLNLKTDLGSSVSKIPLVGYILLGDDNSVSTTMKITGKLSNPKVKSLLAKDIAVAPINIIKRAFLLPYDLLQSIGDTNKSK